MAAIVKSKEKSVRLLKIQITYDNCVKHSFGATQIVCYIYLRPAPFEMYPIMTIDFLIALVY